MDQTISRSIVAFVGMAKIPISPNGNKREKFHEFYCHLNLTTLSLDMSSEMASIAEIVADDYGQNFKEKIGYVPPDLTDSEKEILGKIDFLPLPGEEIRTFQSEVQKRSDPVQRNIPEASALNEEFHPPLNPTQAAT